MRQREMELAREEVENKSLHQEGMKTMIENKETETDDLRDGLRQMKQRQFDLKEKIRALKSEQSYLKTALRDKGRTVEWLDGHRQEVTRMFEQDFEKRFHSTTASGISTSV